MKKQLLLTIFFFFCSFGLYAQTYTMGTNTGTQSTCAGNFYDSGGSGGTYANGQNQVITFCPATAGQAIQVNFSSFVTESGFDILYVFNGNSIAANQIASYTGTVSVGAITASNATGCLTFSWHSDGSVVASGWAASVSCVNPPPPTLGAGTSCGTITTNNSLCSSSTSFNLGSGTSTMPTSSCLSSAYGVGWYVLQAQNTNPIQITLSSGSDVDFALWGPFMTPPPYNCSALGATIDCSFTTASTEYVDINAPITGAYYLLAVSNYGGTTGNINLNVNVGTVPCAASPVCNISALTATPSACNAATNTYSVSGTATFSTPPATGTLTISSSCGGSQTINAPFTSPVNYSLTGLTSNGAACTVTATFSATACSRTQTYNAPASCLTCNITASNNGPICSGGNASLSATNATNATTYNWAGPSGFSASGQNVSANNLTTSGTYSVTVTTSTGCTSSATTVLQVNAPPTPSNAGANISLCNSNTFSLAANTPASGTGLWSVIGGSANISTLNLANTTATLTAGTSATLQWTISNSPCPASSSTVTITNLTVPSVSVSTTPVLCNGGNTGTALANPSGGAGAYIYSWSPISGNTANLSNLTAGTYTCYVTDANGCSASGAGLVNQPSVLSATATANPASCNGGLNGSATVTPSGGTSGYTYNWSSFPAQTTQTATNLGFGAYTCVVTDANNCTAAANITVSQPTLLSSNATSSPILCNGGTSIVNVTASGGTIPYTGTGNITVTAGTQTFTITDANGCTASTTLNINEPTTLVGSATNTPILCNGGSSTVTVTASGGTAPYTGTGSFTVAAGSYTYNVTDANGCTASTTVIVTEPNTLTASNSNTPILCNGGTSTVTVSGNGGTLPYIGTGNFTEVAGNYTYTITDANGCTATTSVNISEPTLLVAASSATSILCNGGTADITVSASGGTPAYTGTGTFTVNAGTYAYTVTDANGCAANTSINVTEPATLTASISNTPILCNGGTSTVTVSGNGGTLPYTGTGNFTEITGTYTYNITDANGCTANAAISISEPTLLTTSNTNTDILCNGGTSTVSVSGSGGTLPYTGTGNFTEVAGNYTYTVTDANGCTANTSANISEPTLLVAASAATSILCNGGTADITVSASGGTPVYTGTGTFTVNAGNYTYTVTDANGCTANTSINISQASTLTIAISAPAILCNGGNTTVSISGSGGTLPYIGTGNFTEVVGNYTYTITDANGCTTTDSILITEPTLLTASNTNTAILCNGGTSIVSVSGNGGTLPYTGIGNFTEVAGNYTYTVTDANGCTANTSVNISEPTLLTASNTNTPILCNSGTSTVTVSGNGGTLPYTGIGNFTEVAGTYTYTITDANGCTTTTSLSITEPSLLTASASNTAILCKGDTSTVTVSGNGGTLPYIGIGNFMEVAGTYTYNITDANGCAANTSLSISEPSLLVGNAIASNIACNGGTATVLVSATGGTPAYTGTGTFTVTTGTYTYNISDANGCATTTSVTVGQPNSLSASSTATAILCNGGNSIVTVVGSGGTLPYTGTGNFTELAGTYTYNITDANGCSTSTLITIGEPTLLTASASNTAILCNGGTSTVTVNGNGGTLPYTGIGNFTINAGNYSYNVIDANGCVANTNGNISEPAPLAVAITGSPITCFNGNTLLTVNASGGTAPYNGTGNFTVQAGTYTYNVTDANGCATSANTNVTQPPILGASVSSIKNVNCNGQGGTATITATGGSGNYLYSWIPGNYNQNTPPNIPAGNYTVYVKDAANPTCMTSVSFTIGTAAPLAISGSSLTNLSCNAACDGTITVNATGASGTYNYLWSNGATTATANNLCAGTYNVTISDAQTTACTASATYTVVQPTALGISLQNQQNVLCNGGNTGAITVQANGGWGNYQYNWSNGQTGTTATNLAAGTYTLTVTDSVCSASQTFVITEVGVLGLVSAQVTNATCSNSNNGSISIIATGGSGNYNYSWSGSSVTLPTINNLGAGNYSVFVSEAAASGCIFTQTFTVVDTFDLVATPLVLAQPSCNLSNGMLGVTASGGSGNYNYNWSNGAITPTVSNLAAGFYSVSVSEANAPTCAVLVSTMLVAAEAPSNVIINSATNVDLCEGESLLLSGSATNANSYLWLWNGMAVGFGMNFSATQTGVYQFVAYSGQNTSGCNTASETVTVNVIAKANANILIGGSSAICSGDSIPLIASGGVTYQWLKDGQLILGAKASIYWVRGSGNYSVIASNTCNSDTSNVTPINISLGVVAEFTYNPNPVFEGQTVTFTNQSVNATTWSWIFGNNTGITVENPTRLYESAGQYPVWLIARDEFGCVDTFHTVLAILETDNPFIPNVITPNGDGVGDELTIEYKDLKDTYLSIFDRWGNIVFETTNQDAKWSGTNAKGGTCSEGVYFYVLEGKTALGKKVSHKGNITVMR